MELKKKDFLTLQELDLDELEELITYTQKTKNLTDTPLNGKTVVNLLLTSSIHTRLAMETAVQQLGGRSIVVDFSSENWSLLWDENAQVDTENTEHVKDVAKVLSQYGDLIAVHHIPDTGNWRQDRQDSVIKNLARYSSIPVLNLESALFNPCQALADIITMKEHVKDLRGWKAVLTWSYHPTSPPMSNANSFALVASKYGMDLTVACPSGYELDPGILKLADKNARTNDGSVEITNNLEEGVSGAVIVYAANWRSIKNYSNPEEEKQDRENHKHWVINSGHMDKTDGGYLLHPLPIRRNVSIQSAVLDEKNSLIYEQAANQLHAKKALLSILA